MTIDMVYPPDMPREKIVAIFRDFAGVAAELYYALGGKNLEVGGVTTPAPNRLRLVLTCPAECDQLLAAVRDEVAELLNAEDDE